MPDMETRRDAIYKKEHHIRNTVLCRKTFIVLKLNVFIFGFLKNVPFY